MLNDLILKEKPLKFTCSGCLQCKQFKTRFVAQKPYYSNSYVTNKTIIVKRYKVVAQFCSPECFEYWKLKKC